MVLRPPDSIFRRIVAGKLRLAPADFEPRTTSRGVAIEARFPPGRTERLRTKLLEVGIDPVTVGLPPPKPVRTRIFVPPTTTYRDACREIKYDFVRQQLVGMQKTVTDWRNDRLEEAKKTERKKLPY